MGCNITPISRRFIDHYSLTNMTMCLFQAYMLAHKYVIMFDYFNSTYKFCSVIAIDNINTIGEIGLYPPLGTGYNMSLCPPPPPGLSCYHVSYHVTNMWIDDL